MSAYDPAQLFNWIGYFKFEFQVFEVSARNSGFRRGVNEVFALLGSYSALTGSYPRFGTASRTRNVGNYQPKPRKFSEERIPHFEIFFTKLSSIEIQDNVGPNSYWLTFKNAPLPRQYKLQWHPILHLRKESGRDGEFQGIQSHHVYLGVAEKSQCIYPWPTFSRSLHSGFTLRAQQSERHSRIVGSLTDTTFCLYLDQNQKSPKVPYVTHANSECAGCWSNFPGTCYQHSYTVLLYRLWGQTRLLSNGHRGPFHGLFRG